MKLRTTEIGTRTIVHSLLCHILSTALLATLVLFSGCQRDAQNEPSELTVAVLYDTSQPGYRPVFDVDLPQNVISSRMNHNFKLYWHPDEPPTDEQTESNLASQSATTIQFPSAGLQIYQPPHMKLSDRFTGFINQENQTSLVIMTNPFSMSKITARLVDAEVRAGTSKILYTRKLEVQGREGVFYATRTAYQNLNVGKFVLAFGDQEFSWQLIATFDCQMENKHGDELLKSILSARLSAEPRLPPGGDVDFTMRPNRLLLTDGFVNKLVFTLQAKFPVDSTKSPVFQAGKPLIPAKIDLSERRAFAIASIPPLPTFAINNVSSEKEIQIDGLDGYEFLSQAHDQVAGEPLFMYSVTLFDSEEVYLMHGWVSSDLSEDYIGEFRALAQSFKRKPASNIE